MLACLLFYQSQSERVMIDYKIAHMLLSAEC